jgi:anti-sigma regulatory factor (Ser/Thr protein kinase)
VAACIRLPVDPNSPRVARLFVGDCLRRWGYDSLVSEAELLTSEIVTNAVLHAAREPLVVELDDLADGAVILVADPVDELPVPRVPGLLDAGGRGLQIVQQLASAWGVVSLRGDGKLVWFTLTTT